MQDVGTITISRKCKANAQNEKLKKVQFADDASAARAYSLLLRLLEP